MKFSKKFPNCLLLWILLGFASSFFLWDYSKNFSGNSFGIPRGVSQSIPPDITYKISFRQKFLNSFLQGILAGIPPEIYARVSSQIPLKIHAKNHLWMPTDFFRYSFRNSCWNSSKGYFRRCFFQENDSITNYS